MKSNSIHQSTETNITDKLAALGIDCDRLIKDFNLAPQTQKSNLARYRSTQSKPIDGEILKALKTYQWRETAAMLYFGMSMDVSESFVRLRLKALEQQGKVEAFQDSLANGKPRIIYRLKTCEN